MHSSEYDTSKVGYGCEGCSESEGCGKCADPAPQKAMAFDWDLSEWEGCGKCADLVPQAYCPVSTGIRPKVLDDQVEPCGIALSRQVGGDHYKNFKIQPVEFIVENNLSFLPGSVIKRMCRYKLKGNALQDLRKARHEIDLLIELGDWKTEAILEEEF